MHDGSSDEAAHLQEELRVGAAELAAVRAELRAVVAKVLGRLEGLRGELQELKTGKAWSDERIAKLEESECGCGGGASGEPERAGRQAGGEQLRGTRRAGRSAGGGRAG